MLFVSVSGVLRIMNEPAIGFVVAAPVTARGARAAMVTVVIHSRRVSSVMPPPCVDGALPRAPADAARGPRMPHSAAARRARARLRQTRRGFATSPAGATWGPRMPHSAAASRAVRGFVRLRRGFAPSPRGRCEGTPHAPLVNGNRKPHICGNRKLHTSGEDVSGGADILPVMPVGRVGLDAGSGATGVLANTRRDAAEPAVTWRLPHAVRPTLSSASADAPASGSCCPGC